MSPQTVHYHFLLQNPCREYYASLTYLGFVLAAVALMIAFAALVAKRYARHGRTQ